ncbi:hypothetical protein D3C73_1000420 [compost metagenome]
MANRFPEAAGVVFLEEAFLGPALRASNEADRPRGRPGQHDGRNGGVIFRQLTLGDLALGIDDPLGVCDRHDHWRLRLSGRPCLLDHNGFGLLVVAQAEIARMTQRAFVGHFGEGDFRYELGTEPVGAPDLCARRFDGRRFLFERAHDGHEPLQFLSVKSCPDLARIAQGAVLVDGEDQGTKGARLVRRRPSDHGELLALDAFGLNPPGRSRADVASIGQLRHHAFQARCAEAVQQLFTAPTNMVGVAESLRLLGH